MEMVEDLNGFTYLNRDTLALYFLIFHHIKVA